MSMKKTIMALTSMAGLALLTACGGSKDNKGGATATGQNDEQQTEYVEPNDAESSALDKFKTTLTATYGITLADIAPDFEWMVQNANGQDLFYGEEKGTKVAAHFQKNDNSDVTQDEFNAFATKLYNLTKGLSQDGKNVNGFGNAESLDAALAEKTIESCIGKNEYGVDIIWTGWEFRKDNTFYRVDLMKGADRSGAPEYIDFTIDKSLQKPLSELMDEADKAMEQAGY